MDIILVPGLWLDASSWDAVTGVLASDGHRVRPLTMPGVGAPHAASEGIGIDDWVDAVVTEIHAAEKPVVLVGHSGGGNVVYAAAGRRPDDVALVVMLDTFPPVDGTGISDFPVVDGVVPFPGWDFFDDDDVADLTPDVRADAAGRTMSVPAAVPTDPIRLGDDRRRSIPLVIITGTVPEVAIRGLASSPPAWASELAALEDLRVIQLHDAGEPGGHWPQFSAAQKTAEALADAVRSLALG